MTDPSDTTESFRRQLIDDGVIESVDAVLMPMTGGISSDIFRVEDGDRVFVVKRALPQLKVEDEWFADVSRNRFEQAYLEKVGSFLPDAVPEILAASLEHGYFAMEHLDGFANWKTLLLKGYCDPDQARAAGTILGTIHRKTWDNPDCRRDFDSTENFHQLRIEPYLLTTAKRTPDLSGSIRLEAKRLRESRHCLVHGDYSPKNLLFQGERLVLLDCEVAWFGDPGFDVAFLLNHLLLKALHLDDKRAEFIGLAMAAWDAYRKALKNPGRIDTVADSTGGLLPILMLARIDGKSPVEYLADDETKKRTVREFVAEAIPDRKYDDPQRVITDWLIHLETSG